jgi:anti-anti-sigma factor
VTCSGRIVIGPEVDEFAEAISRLVREVDTIELDLSEVSFLDSSGIGALVRALVRTRVDGKTLKFLAVSEPVRKTLQITNLLPQFATMEQRRSLPDGLRVLFVHPTPTVRVFVDSLLRQSGAYAETCASAYDARMLADPSRFDVVVVCAETATASFPGLKMLKLEPDFFNARAEEAGQALLARLHSTSA